MPEKGRRATYETILQGTHCTDTEPEITVRTKLADIAQRAGKNKDAKFCSLAHLMNKNTLKESFKRISNTASPGIDKVTKEEYEKNLDDNLADLVSRLKE